MSTIRSGRSRVGQPDDAAGRDLTAVAVAKTADIAAETEVVLLLANADRPAGHRIPVLDRELIPRYLVDKGHTRPVRPQVAEVTSVALRSINVAVCPFGRVEVRPD